MSQPTPPSVEAEAGRAARLAHLIRGQALHATRNAAALRPFGVDEFGSGTAGPTRAHIEAANRLLGRLQRRLLMYVRKFDAESKRTLAHPDRSGIEAVLAGKELAERAVKSIEQVWDFYFKLFSQRGSRFGERLLALDRVALDCYQAVYTGLEKARPVPSPPPFTALETGRTPSTYRRAVRLSRLGRRANPFPLVQLPLHRLVNPWTLGAVHHEVSHNLQSDLGLWEEVPRRVGRRLLRAGLPPGVARVWQRWHKEIWADLCGLLLGGPAIVVSLFDVLVRPAARAQSFNPRGVHPPPYLRALVNLELLRRLGFARDAAELSAVWRRLYPTPDRGSLPPDLLATFAPASRQVVSTICFEPYEQLGGKPLVRVVRFTPAHQAMVREAARRLAAGNDPGIIPERFLVAAARDALERRYTRPETIHRNFYRALARR